MYYYEARYGPGLTPCHLRPSSGISNRENKKEWYLPREDKLHLDLLVGIFRTSRGLLARDQVILKHSQVTRTTPELAAPLLTTTPHQREDVRALDRFKVHRSPTRRVFGELHETITGFVVNVDSTMLRRLSDEAHFWLNGYVNKQNCRIWSEANPQVYVETPLHPEKLTVWCALWAGGILLQKR
ncbi:uncharacterized protein TNCV_1465401 [Trichonephila clavipes]|nr:uncharacterized protein TNCV_1465401 [Trichonephila clavipes]